MLTLIISAVIAIISAMTGNMFNSTLAWIVSGASAVIGVCITLFPIEGFEATEVVEKYSLLPLKFKIKTNKRYYVVKLGNRGCFAYDISTEYGIRECNTLYEEKRVKGKIKIYEKDENVSPILMVCKTKPIRDYWAIAPFSTKKEYIFIIPSGTVWPENVENVPDVV